MGFRQVFIKKGKYLYLKDNNLVIVRKEDQDKVLIPLEDISLILIEDPFAVITAKLICEASSHGISIILCNASFYPAVQTFPLYAHYNQTALLKKQISLDAGTKAILWQKIITYKIENQYQVLQLTNHDEKALILLNQYKKEVELNDFTAREGIAAKVFFSSIHGNDFIRFEDSGVARALNYGYTILLNTIVRYCNLYGLNTCLGIWHESDKNSFNLACDFIEPFRPLIDYIVYWNRDLLEEEELTFDLKKKLINVLNTTVLYHQNRVNVEYAIDLVIKSYLVILETGDAAKLEMPTILETLLVEYE